LKYKKQAFPSPKPQLSLQQTLIFLYFLVCNLRAVLCYCYVPVTEHFCDTFDGDAVADRYCSGEGVACYGDWVLGTRDWMSTLTMLDESNFLEFKT